MRLNINLASQPYEDARRFMIAWSSVIGALLIVLVVLSIAAVKRFQHYQQLSRDLSRERQVLQDLNIKQQQGLAILNRPENRDVRDKSEFINSLIRRKEVSWTKIFTDLEQLMPSHLRVLAVEPVEKDDQILIRMLLGGDSREQAATLVRRMERSNVFRSAQISNESDLQSAGPAGQGAGMRFEITAEYVPGEALALPEHEKAQTGGGQ